MTRHEADYAGTLFFLGFYLAIAVLAGGPPHVL